MKPQYLQFIRARSYGSSEGVIVDLETLCGCTDYQHEARIEKGMALLAWTHNLPLPQIRRRFCPYCGNELKYPPEYALEE